MRRWPPLPTPHRLAHALGAIFPPPTPPSLPPHQTPASPTPTVSRRSASSFVRPVPPGGGGSGGRVLPIIQLKVPKGELDAVDPTHHQRTQAGQGDLGPSALVPPPTQPNETPPADPLPAPPPASSPSLIQDYTRQDVLDADPDTLKALADAGHSFAQHYLGVLHLNGLQGVPLDRTLARHYLHLSLHTPSAPTPTPTPPLQHPLSAFFLASLCERGEGGPMGAAQALSLYRRYAEWAGNGGVMGEGGREWYGESLVRAGRLAMGGVEGEGEPGQRGDAEWERGWGEVRAAAEVGNVEAMLMVAQRAAEDAQAGGEGGGKEEEARRWMRRAQEGLEAQLVREHGVEGTQRLMREVRDEDEEDEEEEGGDSAERGSPAVSRPVAAVKRPAGVGQQGSKAAQGPMKSSWKKRGKKRN